MGYAHQSAGRRFLPLLTAPRHTCISLPQRLISRVRVCHMTMSTLEPRVARSPAEVASRSPA
eukprot:959427-Prymnesium_polylepis.1